MTFSKGLNLQFLRVRHFSAVLRLCVLLGGTALVAFGTTKAEAQNTGTIFGTVTDSSGAIVPHAHVVVVDKEHGLTRTGDSNTTGNFNFPALPVGTYQLTVTMKGFETYVVNGVHLDAEENQKESVVLKAGSEGVTVTVEADSAILDTKSATLGTVIDNNLVENLPIDGENVVALASLLPGVTDVNAPVATTSDTGGPTFSANGGRSNQNLMLFDGLMFNNLFFNTGINYPPHPALQEVSVVLNNYKAQYGRSAGSIFNVLTKQGTNQYHGQVWDYIQNSFFNASDYVTKTNPQDNYNQFGFTVGGPVKRDKLFFFLAFQQLVGRIEQVGEGVAPTYADRGLTDDGSAPRPCLSTGAFPGHTCAMYADQLYVPATTAVPQPSYNKLVNPLDAGGSSGSQGSPEGAIANINSAWTQAGGTGTSPCLSLLAQADVFASTHKYFDGYNGFTQTSQLTTTNTYLPYGEVPTECLNPVMMKIWQKYIPVPTFYDIGQGALETLTHAKTPIFESNVLGRSDYHMGRHTIDARYNFVTNQQTYSLGGNVVTFDPDDTYSTTHFGNVGDTWVITPNLLNVMHIGYKRFQNGQTPTDHNTLNTFGGNLIIPGVPTMPAMNGGASLGKQTQGFANTVNENFEVQESVSWTKGRHNFGFGFNFLRLQYLNKQNYAGQFSFSSSYTRVSMVDAAFGLPKSFNVQSQLIQGGIQHDAFFYAQDDWRITRNLTLNLGLRYELPFQWFEPHGQAATFKAGQQSTVFPQAPGGQVYPGDTGVLPSLVPTDFNGFAPRFGFAYDVSGQGKLVIRGGFGMFFDAVNANVVGVGEPYHFILNKNYPLGGFSNPLLGYPAVPGAYDPKNPIFLAPYSIFFPDKNFRTPYIEAFNFGYQYRVQRGGSLQMNYVGRLARKLPIPLDLNPSIYDCSGGYFQSDPARYCTNAASTDQSNAARARYQNFNYGGQGIVDILSVGNGSYHALQTMYQQRGGKNLAVHVSYTFSKSIDLMSNGLTTSNVIPNVFDISSDKGPSDFYSKHILALGWVLKLPKTTNSHALVRGLANGWIYSGKYQARSGHPYSVTINDDQALNGEPNQRAQLVAGADPMLPSNRHRIDRMNEWFNVYAFTYPTQHGVFSSQRRNSYIGPAYIETDMNIGRDFPLSNIREGMRLNFRMEAFNVFNTPNLAQPKTSFSCSSTNLAGGPCTSASHSGAGFSATSTFGKVTNTQGNNGNTQTTGRKMQFAITIFY